MKIYLTKQKDGILVMARAESQDVIGDLVELITAGSTFYGLSYHDLAKLGLSAVAVRSAPRRVGDGRERVIPLPVILTQKPQ